MKSRAARHRSFHDLLFRKTLMYAALPAFVSSAFLFYGAYVVVTKGMTRISMPFFLLCATTFGWQSTWVFLFSARQADVVMILAKLGYLFIIFIPAAFYHFVCELTRQNRDRALVLASYGISLMLSAVLLASNLVVAGYYTYNFGNYPKAGPLLSIHIGQAILVAFRCAWILARSAKKEVSHSRDKFRFCLLALAIYSSAVVDYAANYGYQFYPPGVALIALSLCILIYKVLPAELNEATSGASVAREIRTSLGSIRIQAEEMARAWPHIMGGYRLAVDHGLCPESMSQAQLERISNFTNAINRDIDGIPAGIDISLALVKLDELRARQEK